MRRSRIEGDGKVHGEENEGKKMEIVIKDFGQRRWGPCDL